ncbi:MAG: hypothetical protein FRX49_07148 [Trebouxia sp. A1-2]|nr:MAG: hypothetical protein FRX49_07148 [Trebouxia sp. A1-2]
MWVGMSHAVLFFIHSLVTYVTSSYSLTASEIFQPQQRAQPTHRPAESPIYHPQLPMTDPVLQLPCDGRACCEAISKKPARTRGFSTALIQLDRSGEADLYEAQGQAMCFLCSLDAVNNEQAAGSALQGTHIQQGFQQSPRGAHSGKQGRPHLSVCLARHTDHNVPEQREVADELRCSLKEWPCHQHSSLSSNNRLRAGGVLTSSLSTLAGSAIGGGGFRLGTAAVVYPLLQHAQRGEEQPLQGSCKVGRLGMTGGQGKRFLGLALLQQAAQQAG